VAGRGAERAIVALLGIGLGAAMTTGSDSDRGARGTTSEWGHTVIQVGGLPCRCGSRGRLEAYVGAEAILERVPGSEPFGTSGTESQLAELVARGAEPS
jgi:predicted NBD/HSP70 family sugar kinase